MKLTKFGCFFVLLLILMSQTTFAQDDFSTMTIADIIIAKTEQAEPEFTSLLRGLESAEDAVMETLLDTSDQYTFFAPTEEAFQELRTAIGGVWFSGLFNDHSAITKIMNHHIISGSIEPDDMDGYMRIGGMHPTSLQEEKISIELDADGNITVNGFALVGEPIEAQNGVIYVIDGILLTEFYQGTIDRLTAENTAASSGEAVPTEAVPESAAPIPSEPIRQWAQKASATSEYANPSWSAMQATGAPNTQTCGDHDSAWASAGATSQESLSLEYAVPVIPSQVNIHQTYNPGSIVRVELVNTRTEKVVVIPNSADPPKNTPCPGVFTLDISGVDMPVNGVRIYLDQSIGGNWNEIDAVELVGIPTEAPPDAVVMDSGIDVTCDTGANITNGTKVTVVQMRSGYTYTATAIGMNGFDPVLAVLDESGHGLCNDDDKTASLYNASLPTTGLVDAMSDSARVHFAQNSGGSFEDVSLIVGGYEQSGGEFLLVLEGMAVTRADEEGDPFSVMITPAMRAANVPVTVYMLANTTALDPYIAAVDETISYYMEDGAGNLIACDDAGDPGLCWGVSDKLSGYFFTNATDRSIPGGQVDAMLTIPVAELGAAVEKMTLLMTSSENRSFGEYTLIFHIGLGK